MSRSSYRIECRQRGGIAGLKVPPLSEPPWTLDDSDLSDEEIPKLRMAIDDLRRPPGSGDRRSSDSFQYEFVITERTTVVVDESEITPAVRALLERIGDSRQMKQ